MNTRSETPGGNKKPALTRSEFDLLRLHVQQISGIALDESKLALMEARLRPLLEKFECNTYADLYVRSQTVDDINLDICSAISTNETSFFRDPELFGLIAEKIIPDVLNRSNSLAVWSAAASTGQEAYSTIMVMRETIPNCHKYNLRVEGTDISRDNIAYASYGAYTPFELQRGVSEARLHQHFTLHDRGYRVTDEVRYLAHFRHLNLLKSFPFGAEFDLILCRNVAIYFDAEHKKCLFDRLANCLKPSGKLLIGSTETLWHITDAFHRHSWNGLVYYSLEEGDTVAPKLSS